MGWRKEVDETAISDNQERSVKKEQLLSAAKISTSDPQDRGLRVLCEVIPKVTPNVFRERFLTSNHCVNDQLSHSLMLILSATNLEANCAVKAIAIADNMIYLLRIRKRLVCMTAWNPLWQMKGARQIEP